MGKWYVIKVMPGKERQLSEQFNTQITMGNIGYISRFVCPLEKEFVVVKKKKTIREKVIYNGYLYFESESKLNDGQLKEISNYFRIDRWPSPGFLYSDDSFLNK